MPSVGHAQHHTYAHSLQRLQPSTTTTKDATHSSRLRRIYLDIRFRFDSTLVFDILAASEP